MEFLSPKTKERLSKLEQENAQLRAAVEAKGNQTNKVSPWIPWSLVVVSIISMVIIWLSSKGPTDDEIAQRHVELWRDGQIIDTIVVPSSELIFSIQVGAYRDIDMVELSHGLKEMSFVKDSAFTRINLGEYTSLPEAQEFLELVINMGFEHAFIVAYKDDNAVGLLSNKTALN